MKNLNKFFIISVLLFSVFTNEANAEAPIVKRLEGKNRIETSIEVSKEAFNKSNTAIIVGYNGEVDALTGTILADKKQAPILMSYKNRLDKSLVEELKRLRVKNVFIIGGKSVLEPIVEKELKALNLNVVRIMGNSREETAINISKEAIDEGSEEAFLALGYGVYADALAIGPIAANKNVPLLLTQGEKIGDSTLDYLKDINVKTVTIVGGEGAVGKSVEKSLENADIRVKRIEGSSREETAVNIANEYLKDPQRVIVANGYKYADAVVGGYLGAKENSPILLSNSKGLKDVNKEYIREKRLDTTVLGGNSSIGESIVKEIKVDFQSNSLNIDKEPVGIGPSTDNQETIELPKNLDQLKVVMKRKLENLEANINIEYKGNITSDKVREVIRDIYADGSYIGGAIASVTPRVIRKGNDSEVVLSAKYYNTKAEEAFIDSEVGRIIKKIIKPGMSEFEKVKTVHDYIIENTVYSTESKKTPHSAYAVLKEGKGVCQGYALLAYRFFEQLDIENYYVIGKSEAKDKWGLHAWNLVKIDGKYYNLDITKDDPLVVDGNHVLSYRYFLVSDKKFAKTHAPNRDIFPKAVDAKYEVLNGLYNPSEYKGNLYFGNKEDGDKMYTVSLKDLKLKKISDNRAPYLVTHGGKIYFSNYSSGGYLYSSDLNGKNLQKLNSAYSTNLKLEYPAIKFFNKNTNKWDKLDLS